MWHLKKVNDFVDLSCHGIGINLNLGVDKKLLPVFQQTILMKSSSVLTDDFLPPPPSEEYAEVGIPPTPPPPLPEDSDFIPPPPPPPEEDTYLEEHPPLPVEEDGEIIPPPPPEEEDAEDEYSKNRSRWGAPSKKVQIAAITAVLPAALNHQKFEQYLINARLEEIARKLRTGDVVPSDRERSPSPPPAYDGFGRRTNMREARYRKRLEDERARLVDLATKTNPNFRMPSDSLRRAQCMEKLWIPTKKYPGINFVGLLIGPRGTELRKMERESGAKISIRGKGAVKEGKSNQPGAEEELHAYITADCEEKIHAATKCVNRIISIAVSSPETDNELKKQQLRELAEINGTFKTEDMEICSNCGAVGHRKYDCPEQRNFTISLVCQVCGAMGHLSRDCMNRHDPTILRASNERQKRIQTEYQSFMSEINK